MDRWPGQCRQQATARALMDDGQTEALLTVSPFVGLRFLQDLLQYLFLINLFGAEEPILALHVFFPVHTVLGNPAGTGRRYDDIFPRLPIRGRGDIEGVTGLEGDQRAAQLGEIAPQAQGVINDGANGESASLRCTPYDPAPQPNGSDGNTTERPCPSGNARSAHCRMDTRTH